MSTSPLFEATKARRCAIGVFVPSASGWNAIPAPTSKVDDVPCRRWLKGCATAAKYESTPCTEHRAVLVQRQTEELIRCVVHQVRHVQAWRGVRVAIRHRTVVAEQEDSREGR